MRIRPGRTQSLIGGIVVLIVTVVGLTIMPRSGIPGGMPGGGDIFGIFRILWVGFGLIGAGVSFYNAFSRKGVALYEIDSSDDRYSSPHEEGSFCPQCGKSVGQDDRFCRNCGAHLRR
jgi:hypothetical protein